MSDIIPIGTLVADQYASNTNRNSFPVNASRNVPAGRTLVVAVAIGGAGSGGDTFSATDAKGNTYHFCTPSSLNGGTRQVALLVGDIQTALVAGDAITITDATGNRGRWAVVVEEFSGCQANPMDDSEEDFASTTSLATGPVTPTQASCLLFAAYSVGPAKVVSAGGGFSAGGQQVTDVAQGSQHKVATTFLVVDATPAAHTTSDTQDSTGSWAGKLISLKAAATQDLTVVATVTYAGTWTKNPSSGMTDPAILNDSDVATYLQSPDNPTGTAKVTVPISTPSPLPNAATDTVSFDLDFSAPGASTASVTIVVKSGSNVTRETFTGLTIPPSGGHIVITLASATVTAIGSASQWGSVVLECAVTAAA